MKKIISSLVLLFIFNLCANAQQELSNSAAIYPQQIKPVVDLNAPFLSVRESYSDNDYATYKRRARRMRTTGLCLLGAGLVTGVTGLLIATSDYDNISYEARQRKDDASVALFIVSAATGIASIPFMVIASVNQHKANVLLKSEKTSIPGKMNGYTTGIAMQISIGK